MRIRHYLLAAAAAAVWLKFAIDLHRWLAYGIRPPAF